MVAIGKFINHDTFVYKIGDTVCMKLLLLVEAQDFIKSFRSMWSDPVFSNNFIIYQVATCDAMSYASAPYNSLIII